MLLLCLVPDHDMAKRHFGEALKYDPDYAEARKEFNKVRPCLCVCVCVCARERERERPRVRLWVPRYLGGRVRR